MKSIVLKSIVSILIAAVFAAGAIAGGTILEMNFNMSNSFSAKQLLQSDKTGEIKIPNDLPNDFNVLLLGVDASENRRSGDEASAYDNTFRSDTIIVAHVNTQEKKVSLLSLERDIKSKFEGYDGYYKLNAAYALGGVDLMTKEAEKLIGEEIPYYVAIDMSALEEIIDSVGGIDVNVEAAFYDEMLKEGIEKAGMQHLDGHKAVVYARSRYAWEDGDFARMRHQREVIAALASKLMKNDNPLELYNAAETLSKKIATNMPVNQIFELAYKMRGIDIATNMYSLTTPTIPLNEDGVSYQELDKKQWQKVLDQFDNFEDPNAIPESNSNANQTENMSSNMSDLEAAEKAIASGNATKSTNASGSNANR